MTTKTDTFKWQAHAHVDKYDADQTKYAQLKSGILAPTAAVFTALGIKPSDTADRADNLLTTAGLTRLVSLMVAAGGQAPTNTAARIGTGDGAGSAAVGDTDLSAAAGSTHRWFQVMDATFPTIAAAVITFKSTFGTADGNYAWNEWGIDIGTPTVSSSNAVSATLLNHKTSAALGTKASGSTWAFTTTITFS